MMGSQQKHHAYFYSREKAGQKPESNTLVKIGKTPFFADPVFASACSLALSPPVKMLDAVRSSVNAWLSSSSKPLDVENNSTTMLLPEPTEDIGPVITESMEQPLPTETLEIAEVTGTPIKFNLMDSEITEKRTLIDKDGKIVTTDTYLNVLAHVRRIEPNFKECIGQDGTERGLQNAIDQMALNIRSAQHFSNKFQLCCS